MVDGFWMSVNSKLKKIISGLGTNEEKIDGISVDVSTVQTTSDNIYALISSEIQT